MMKIAIHTVVQVLAHEMEAVVEVVLVVFILSLISIGMYEDFLFSSRWTWWWRRIIWIK
jgi:hypothetical protein